MIKLSLAVSADSADSDDATASEETYYSLQAAYSF